MNLRGYFSSAIPLIGLFLISCANSNLEPSNTIRVSNLPALNLQLAREYEKQVSLYDEALLRGYIDEGFYIVGRNKMQQAVRDQIDMYEGGVREQMFGCHSGGGAGLNYLFFEPEDRKKKSWPHVKAEQKTFIQLPWAQQ